MTLSDAFFRYTVRNSLKSLIHISLDDMWLAVLQFEMKLENCISIGITIFKIVIWGGISSNLTHLAYRVNAEKM